MLWELGAVAPRARTSVNYNSHRYQLQCWGSSWPEANIRSDTAPPVGESSRATKTSNRLAAFRDAVLADHNLLRRRVRILVSRTNLLDSQACRDRYPAKSDQISADNQTT